MKISKEYKIGIFVLSVLLVSFFVINFLRGKDVFNREIDLTAKFESVDGLLPAAPVFIRGYKAGSVVDIEYDRNLDLFIVDCSVDKDFIIPKDSRLVIYSTDIMGGKGVKVELGRSRKEAKNNSELKGVVEKDLVASLSEGVTPLINSLVETMISAKSLLSNMNSILSEDNKSSLSSALAAARKTMHNMEKISIALERKSPEIENFITDLAVISEKLSSSIDSADSTISDINKFAESLNDSDIFALVSNVNALMESIRNPDGLFGKMLADDKIYDSVDSLVCNINSLVEKIQDNPKKYMKLSVF